jgi:hypothetical protein
MPLDMVGKPSQIGGIASRVVGYGALAITFAIVALGATLAWSFASPFVGVLTALIAMFGTLAGWFLVRAGNKLQRDGTSAQRAARESTLLAAARNKGGILTLNDAVVALNVAPTEAEELLTALAKEGSRVALEIDSQGTIKYVFREAAPIHTAATAGSAQAASVSSGALSGQQPSTGVRVDAAHLESEQATRDRVRANVDREYEELKKTKAAQK